MTFNINDINTDKRKPSRYLMNIKDLLVEKQIPVEMPEEAPPEEETGAFRGLGTDVLKAGIRGLIGMGEMTARIPRAFDIPISEEKGGIIKEGLRLRSKVIHAVADPVVEGARMLLNEPDLQYSPEYEKSIVRRAIVGGIEAAPQSALGMITAALGPLGWVGVLGIYGSAQFDRHIEQSLKEGKTYEESLPYALASAFIEGGGEAIADKLGARFLGIGNANKLIRSSSKNVKGLLTTTYGSYIKGVIKQIPVETVTEVGQNVGETLMQKLQGLEAPGIKEAAIESIGPAIVMTALFGAGSAGMNKIQEKQIKEALENPAIDPKARLQAAGYVYEQLNTIDKEAKTTDAELWSAIATNAINQGQPIDLSINLKEVNKAIEQKDHGDNFVSNLENDLNNGNTPIEVVERIRDKMPQYADEINKVIGRYRTKDPLGSNFVSNQAIGNVSKEVDDKLDNIFLPGYEKLQEQLKKKEPVTPEVVPTTAEEAIKIVEERTQKGKEELQRRREKLEGVAPVKAEAPTATFVGYQEDITGGEPVPFYKVTGSDKISGNVTREILEKNKIEVPETPEPPKVKAEKVAPEVAKQPWEMTRDNYIIQEAGPIQYGNRPNELAYPYNKKYFSAVSKHTLEVERAIKEGKPVPESVLKDYPELRAKPEKTIETPALKAEVAGATPKREAGEAKKAEIAPSLTGITAVKAVRNANKKFDLIDRRTKKNVLPGMEFNTPREAKDYFERIKGEQAGKAEAKGKAETALEKITVTRKAVHAETGETIDITQDAKTALDEIEGQRIIYRNILECVS